MLTEAEKAESEQRRARTFEYHKDGDSIFHGRVNAMLVSQSMFLAGFVISCGWARPVNQGCAVTGGGFMRFFPVLIAGIAILILLLFWLLNSLLHKRLEYLKMMLIKDCTVYNDYLLVSVGYKLFLQRQGSVVPSILPHFVPAAFLIFWVGTTILYLANF